jgi:arylsulfatase A-like enzyme
MKKHNISLFIMCCLMSASALCAADNVRPNIIFILIDDFGYADSGPYGAKDIRTPNMDRLANEGIKFTDFYANAPVCTPTRCGFITGRWQQRYGFEFAMGYMGENFRRVGDQWVKETDIHSLGLSNRFQTLPKLLKQAGYATGAFGKWHLGSHDEFNPVHHGFDTYFGVLLGHADYFHHAYFDGTYAMRDGLEPVKKEGYVTDLINQRASKFIDDHAKEPFFLYVPHLAVHAPYQPPGRPLPSVTKENMNDGDRTIYAAMVERVDQGVGMILESLKRNGLTEKTLVVLSSDNGGSKYSDNSPLFHQKGSLWEGGIRVPCLMRWPGRLPAGAVSKQVGITMDLSATFAALAGVEPAKDQSFDGINLLPLVEASAAPRERTLCWRIDNNGTARHQKAVRQGNWKLMLDGKTELLFDLATDISERANLSVRFPELVVKLKAALAAWEADIARDKPEILIK